MPGRHDPATQLVRFFHYLDTHDYERMTALMTPDVFWLRQGKPIRGRADALTTLRARNPRMRVRHAVSNLLVGEPGLQHDAGWRRHGPQPPLPAPGASTVYASCYLTAYRYDDPAESDPPWPVAAPHKFSVIHTCFVEHDAAWKIAAQLMVAEFVFPAEGHA